MKDAACGKAECNGKTLQDEVEKEHEKESSSLTKRLQATEHKAAP